MTQEEINQIIFNTEVQNAYKYNLDANHHFIFVKLLKYNHLTSLLDVFDRRELILHSFVQYDMANKQERMEGIKLLHRLMDIDDDYLRELYRDMREEILHIRDIYETIKKKLDIV
jgi:hypothetical protein